MDGKKLNPIRPIYKCLKAPCDLVMNTYKRKNKQTN